MKYIAKDGKNQLIIEEEILKSESLGKLVTLFNKAGFSLGSGHDGMEMKILNGNYDFTLTPYVGHSDQHVSFKPYDIDTPINREYDKETGKFVYAKKSSENMDELFKDLIKFYEETNHHLLQSNRLFEQCVEKKTYLYIMKYETEVETNRRIIERLKTILKNYFQKNIENEISYLEVELKKQEDYSRGAWEMYGSELAGDFNSGEIKVLKKLNLMKDILK